jgi:hypothetical protein
MPLISVIGATIGHGHNDRPKQANHATANQACHNRRRQDEAQRRVGRYLRVAQHMRGDGKPPSEHQKDADGCERWAQHCDPYPTAGAEIRGRETLAAKLARLPAKGR